MSNPSVILVIDSLEVGGSESQLVLLASGLKKRGISLHVFALRAEGPLCTTLESRGIRVTNGGLSRGKDRLKFVRGVWRLCKFIFQRRPCVVHAFLPLSNLIGSLSGRLAGASIVITSRRGLGIHQEEDMRWKYFDRISNSLSSSICVNSRAVGDDTINRDGVSLSKIVCIHNGLDFSRFQSSVDKRQTMRMQLNISSSTFAWIMVANLKSGKGHVDLIKAFTMVAKCRDTRLFLVGEDMGAFKQLESNVADFGMNGHIVFLGPRNDVPEILSAMDGFVLSSHSEGLSNAILEAMAAGLPIVATMVGGNEEALQSGRAGVLVPPCDPGALSSAMIELMENEVLRKTISRYAKIVSFEQFSENEMIANYLQVYKIMANSDGDPLA